MKKLIVIGIVAMMVMGLAVAASAALDSDWYVQMRASNSQGIGAGNATLGTKTGNSDAFINLTEDGAYPSAMSARGIIISTIAPGIDVSKDSRAPMNTTTDTLQVWNLLLSNQLGGADMLTLTGWVPATTKLDLSTGGNPNIVVKLSQGTTVLWTVPYGASGAQATPQFTHTFDYTGTPIALQLAASTVPEPGSMVALFSGLIGLVGFGIRRRK